jgi:hypothetical protein
VIGNPAQRLFQSHNHPIAESQNLPAEEKRGTCGGSDAQNPHSNGRFPNRMTLTQGDIMLADTVQPETET